MCIGSVALMVRLMLQLENNCSNEIIRICTFVHPTPHPMPNTFNPALPRGGCESYRNVFVCNNLTNVHNLKFSIYI